MRLPVLLLAVAVTMSACARVADTGYIETTMATGSFGDGRAVDDSLVVASWNIQYGQHVDLAIEEIRADPWLGAADILLLQEMDPDGSEQIAQALGYDFVYYPATRHPKYDQPFGNAVLSRWPILEHEFFALPVESTLPVTSRIAVVAKIDTGRAILTVVSLHSSTVMVPRDVRLEQFEAVRDSIANSEGPVIVGGDFNTASYEDVLELRETMREAGFQHARPPEATARVPRWQEALGAEADLDHFFFRGFQLRANGVVTGTTASDHLPIWAVLEWDEATE